VKYATDADRIRQNVVEDENGCWIWQRFITPYGYGQTAIPTYGPTFRMRTVHAHRVSYEAFVGPIPEGLVIDHLCRVRACSNPAHLEPVTSRENLMRGETLAAANVIKTHCPQGHAYTAGNLRGNRSGRSCRECHKAYMASYNYRRALRAANVQELAA
jgi:hypothetical protein